MFSVIRPDDVLLYTKREINVKVSYDIIPYDGKYLISKIEDTDCSLIGIFANSKFYNVYISCPGVNRIKYYADTDFTSISFIPSGTNLVFKLKNKKIVF